MPKVSLSSASAISSGPVRPVTRASTRAPRKHFAARVELAPRDALAVTGLAALAASRHSFEEARRLAERARRLAPDLAAVDGILGDALVELGRYDEAFDSLRPDGRPQAEPGRLRARRVRARAPRPARRGDRRHEARRRAPAPDRARTKRGRSSSSATSTSTAGDCAPRSAHTARRSPAFRATTARRPASPASRPPAAASTPPSASTAARSRPFRCPSTRPRWGRRSRPRAAWIEAQEAYAVVDATQRLLEANGVRTDLETALVDLDRGRTPLRRPRARA